MIKATLFILVGLSIIDAFQNIRFSTHNRIKLRKTINSCSFKNEQSHYSSNVIVSNFTKNIDRLYTTYDNKYSLIYYKDGNVEEVINKTLKLKYDYDILNVFIVSNKYFQKLHVDLHTNKTI
jgi:subtilase family serine protease